MLQTFEQIDEVKVEEKSSSIHSLACGKVMLESVKIISCSSGRQFEW